jgi:hypothetical protein
VVGGVPELHATVAPLSCFALVIFDFFVTMKPAVCST